MCKSYSINYLTVIMTETKDHITLQTIIKSVTYVLLGLLAWFLMLVILIISSPTYLYRYVIARYLAPFWSSVRPNCNLGEAVTTFGCGCGVEFWGNDATSSQRSSRCAIVTTMIFEEITLISSLEEAIHKRWINGVDENGNLAYPELQQYIDSWLGYMFWRKCENFQLSDHFKIHTIPEIGTYNQEQDAECDKFLNNLMEHLLNKPFPNKKSPWEVHVLQNYHNREIAGDSKKLTAILCRIHHGMADGYSIINAFLDIFENDVIFDAKLSSSPKCQKSIMNKIISNICVLPLRFCYDMGYITSLYLRKRTRLLVPDSKKLWHQLSEKSRLIPIYKVKQIKEKLGVSFTAVLFSCVSATLAKWATMSCMEKVDNIATVMFLPLSGHSRKLRNNFTAMAFDLPISSDLNPTSRAIQCEKNIQHFKYSTLPFILGRIIAPTFLSQVAPVAKFVSKNRSIPTAVSIFRASDLRTVQFKGKKLLAGDYIVGATLGDAGISFTILSYGDYIRVAATAESSIVNRKELQQIISWVEQEFEAMGAV